MSGREWTDSTLQITAAFVVMLFVVLEVAAYLRIAYRAH